MSCYVMLCYAMLCYAMLCYAMLCYAMLCYAMSCHVMSCHVMLSYKVPGNNYYSGNDTGAISIECVNLSTHVGHSVSFCWQFIFKCIIE